MEGKVKIKGLKEAMTAMRAAFPDNPEQQRRLLNTTISGAARDTILPMAKSLADQGDGSGALSEALAPRAVSKSRARLRGKTASVQITPVRANRKATALYINHYYTRHGRSPKTDIVTSGIRHGHLIEFGTVKQAARPFLWPAARSRKGAYINVFAKVLRKKTEAAVRRKRKKVRV